MHRIVMLAISGMLLGSVPLSAQQAQSQGEGFGGPMVGGIYYDMDDLNSRLSDLGFGQLDNTLFIIGGRAYGLIGDRVLMGGSGFGILGQTVQTDSVTARFSGGMGFFDFGYALLKINNYSLVPLIGIGGGGVTLNLEPRQLAAPSFDSVLLDPRRTASLSAAGFALKIGIVNHFAWDVTQERRDNTVSTFKAGGNIEVSVVYLPNMEWKLNKNVSVFNAPDPKNYMVMVTATLLLGGREEQAQANTNTAWFED